MSSRLRFGYCTRMAEFRKGDRVRWSSHGSTADGEIVRKITSDTEAGGRAAVAVYTDLSSAAVLQGLPGLELDPGR